MTPLDRLKGIGVVEGGSALLPPGCCAVLRRGLPVWMGRIAEIPQGIAFDAIVLHPDDVAAMEKATAR